MRIFILFLILILGLAGICSTKSFAWGIREEEVESSFGKPIKQGEVEATFIGPIKVGEAESEFGC